MKGLQNTIKLALVAGLATTASGAVISWSVTDLLAGGDNADFISTNGASVLAINGTDTVNVAGSVTANGVLFQNVDSPGATGGFTVGGVTFTSAAPSTGNQGAFQAGGFTNATVGGLISGGIFNVPSFTFTGLTIGDSYEIQFLINDSRDRNDGWDVGVNDGNGTVVDTIGDLNNATDNNGDSFLGAFIADAASQTVTLTATRTGNISVGDDIATVPNGGQRQINALQLRNTSVVPEPSSTLMLILAGSFALLRRRK
ncbi:PEP-CTERM sorting domain-containing protein [bacterium]|nr:PEP-CTERM sorting domain-containing protein [bacterium]MDB4314402.1 PEP-CTERM sorting domain-containing protein [Akkermansiaceae bacterium]MDB4318304.1 PEP-CTERM sorting domain-containing protein [bacterium]MDB4451583.1 PEP-CTERM sorting domain-containing protein [Akkermansiaceae bacterium]